LLRSPQVRSESVDDYGTRGGRCDARPQPSLRKSATRLDPLCAPVSIDGFRPQRPIGLCGFQTDVAHESFHRRIDSLSKASHPFRERIIEFARFETVDHLAHLIAIFDPVIIDPIIFD
jgi:hypothetical protein